MVDMMIKDRIVWVNLSYKLYTNAIQAAAITEFSAETRGVFLSDSKVTESRPYLSP